MQVILNITSTAGSHKVVLSPDPNNARSFKASVDDKSHDIYECSASSEGNVLNFSTDIHTPFGWVFRGDRGTLTVDAATSAVSMDIAKADLYYTGVLGPGEAAKVIALVKARKLPDLAA